MQEALDQAQRQKKAEAKLRKPETNVDYSSSSKPRKGPSSGSMGGGNMHKSRRSSTSQFASDSGKKGPKHSSAGKGPRSQQDVESRMETQTGLESTNESGQLSSSVQGPDGQGDATTTAVAEGGDQTHARLALEVEEHSSTDVDRVTRDREHERDKSMPNSGSTGFYPSSSSSYPQQQQGGVGSGTYMRASHSRGRGRGTRGGRGGAGGHYGRSHSEHNAAHLSPNNRRFVNLPGGGGGVGSPNGYAQFVPRNHGDYSTSQNYNTMSPSNFYPGFEGGFESFSMGPFVGTEGLAGGAGAPFPQPVTQVGQLNGRSMYILGQLEYYFSMQNLAMDFFLRQQMDNRGWVDMNMISSFNRLKSLGADVDMVKQVAEMSSIIEVADEYIRLAHGQWKQWVLPDAKPSSVNHDQDDGGDTLDAAAATANHNNTSSNSNNHSSDRPLHGEIPFGLPQQDFSPQARDKLVDDIHRNVMRSVNGSPASTAAVPVALAGNTAATAAASETMNSGTIPQQLQTGSGLTKSVPGGLEADSIASQTTVTDEAGMTKTNTPATSVSDEPDPHDKLEIIL